MEETIFMARRIKAMALLNGFCVALLNTSTFAKRQYRCQGASRLPEGWRMSASADDYTQARGASFATQARRDRGGAEKP
jgi:hypothetical protein